MGAHDRHVVGRGDCVALVADESGVSLRFFVGGETTGDDVGEDHHLLTELLARYLTKRAGVLRELLDILARDEADIGMLGREPLPSRRNPRVDDHRMRLLDGLG